MVGYYSGDARSRFILTEERANYGMGIKSIDTRV